MQRETCGQIIGDGHARHGPNIEQALLEENLTHGLVRVSKLKAEAITYGRVIRASGRQVQIGMLLTPRATRLFCARKSRVDVETRQGRTSPAVKIFQMCSGQNIYDQERRSARSAREVQERTIP